jgi:hypothetical protein
VKKTCERLRKLQECKLQVFNYIWSVVRSANPREYGITADPDTVRSDSFALVKLMVELNGFDPGRLFPMAREILGVPPLRRYTKRRHPPKPDPYRNDMKVQNLRKRLGFIPQHRIQNAQKFIRELRLLTCDVFGHVKGRGKQCAANAWGFGKEIAKLLSAAFLRHKNQMEKDQDKARRLSDFLKRGLGDLAQKAFPFLFPVATQEPPVRQHGTSHGHGSKALSQFEKAVKAEESEAREAMAHLKDMIGKPLPRLSPAAKLALSRRRW